MDRWDGMDGCVYTVYIYTFLHRLGKGNRQREREREGGRERERVSEARDGGRKGGE